MLRVWLAERGGAPRDPLFPTRTGRPLSRDAVEHRLARHLATARATCPSLRTKRVTRTRCATPPPCACCTPASTSPSSRSGSATSSSDHANIYLHADMTQKERAIARTTPPGTTPGRYRPPDTLLAFLEAL